MNINKNTKKSFKSLLLLLSIGLIFGMIISLGMAQIVQETSDDKFCIACHTMKPVTNAYLEDVHGGKNPQGIKAKCNDCHLPHGNVVNYMYQKAKIGLHDVRIELFGDLENINWEEKRKHSSSFVFDSGCLNCHTNLKNATSATPKGYIAHRDYFLKITNKSCVDCHKNVGHKNLSNEINKIKNKKEQ